MRPLMIMVTMLAMACNDPTYKDSGAPQEAEAANLLRYWAHGAVLYLTRGHYQNVINIVQAWADCNSNVGAWDNVGLPTDNGLEYHDIIIPYCYLVPVGGRAYDCVCEAHVND